MQLFKFVCFITIFCMCVIIYFILHWWVWNSHNTKLLPNLPIRELRKKKYEQIIKKLKDNACNFPILNPYDKNMTAYFKPKKVICTRTKPYYFKSVNTNSTPVIEMTTPLPDTLRCCYEHLRFSNTSNYEPLYDDTDRCIFISQNFTEIVHDSMYIIINCWSSQKREIQFKDWVQMTNIKAKPYHQEFLLFVPKPSKEKPTRAQSHFKKLTPKLNVIVIAYDGVSRMNFIRNSPKSYKYLKHNLTAIDLQGFNKIGDNTLNNSLAFLTGYDYTGLRKTCWKSDEDYLDECPWIWKNFSEAGYVTAHADDTDDVFSYRFKGFQNQPTDYYFQPLAHWYNIYRLKRWEKFGSKECIGNNRLLNLMFDHTIKLSGALRDHPYFQYAWQSNVQGNVGYFPLTDTPMFETLKHLEDTGILNTSVVLLVSDHGWRTGAIMLHPQARLENRQSFSFMILPKWFHHLYPLGYRNLIENQYRLTTPYDVYSTMLDLIDPEKTLTNTAIQQRTSAGEASGSKVSLFLPVSKQRTCKTALIDDLWCSCGHYKPFPAESKFATELGEFAVQTINSWLKPFPDCYQYTLKQVISVEIQSAQLTMFRLVFSANPRNAQFEVLIYDDQRENNKSLALRMSTEVFRLNRYTQSKCIDVYSLKKHCTCR